MVSVPAATPETIPTNTVAVALLLLHKPPVAASVKVVVEPAHTVDVPVIVPASGCGLTVIIFVAVTVPQVLVTE